MSVDFTKADIRQSPAQTEGVREMLVRAFFDDPPNVWIFPDEDTRRRALGSNFKMVCGYGDRYGEVYTASAEDGAAVWLPPERPMVSVVRLLRVGAWEMASSPIRFGVGFVPRILATMSELEKLHRQDMPGRHWYLMAVGVDPAKQGQGIGSDLIQPGLEKADRQRLPAYLETTKEINVTFYEKHGFEVVREFKLPQDGPMAWTMRREPIG